MSKLKTNTFSGTALFVTPSAYLLGGVAVWLHYVLLGLQNRGWDIVLGCVDGDFHKAQSYLDHYSFKPSIVIPNPSRTAHGRVKALCDAAKEVDADMLVSVHLPDVYRAAAHLKKNWKRELKLVSTIHALEADFFHDAKFYESVIDGLVVTNKLSVEVAKGMLCNAQYKVGYAAYGVSPDLFELNPQQIENTSVEQRGQTDPVQAPSGQLPDKLTVLYCGRIDNEQKRCSDLVEIAEGMINTGLDFKFLLVGDGPYKDELVLRLKRILHDNQLVVKPSVEPEKMMSEVYAHAQVLLLSSEWETGPLVIWEAMAAGLAVVSSRYAGSKQETALVNEQNCLLFDVGDTQTAVTQLKRLESMELVEKLTADARQLVKSRYTIDASVDAWQQQLALIATQQPQILDQKVFESEPKSNGLLETLFGGPWATSLRLALGKPAMVNSAGDEWPHALQPVSAKQHMQFQSLIRQS